MSNILVIHPEDSSTKFLKVIYTRIKNKTVITGGINKTDLKELIKNHDRVIMLGHGSPMGLFSVNRFTDAGSYIIDESIVDSLRNKTNNVFIWCNADQFVLRNQLKGFFSGMFISEVGEAFYCGFPNVDWNLVTQSNNEFASIISRYINQPTNILYENVLHEYGDLARLNPIARYNLQRLYLN